MAIFDIFGNEAEIGGAPLNFCAHAAAQGAESTLISAVGNDPLGFIAKEKMHFFGVKNEFIKTNDYSCNLLKLATTYCLFLLLILYHNFWHAWGIYLCIACN